MQNWFYCCQSLGLVSNKTISNIHYYLHYVGSFKSMTLFSSEATLKSLNICLYVCDALIDLSYTSFMGTFGAFT